MSHQPNEGVRPSMQMATGATVSGKVDVGGMDETEYLLRNPNNARRLLESVREIDAFVNALEGARKEPAG